MRLDILLKLLQLRFAYIAQHMHLPGGLKRTYATGGFCERQSATGGVAMRIRADTVIRNASRAGKLYLMLFFHSLILKYASVAIYFDTCSKIHFSICCEIKNSL